MGVDSIPGPICYALNVYDDANLGKSDTFKLLKTHLLRHPSTSPLRVINIGVGKRGMKNSSEAMGVACDYKSMDISKKITHDYDDINSIDGKFDVVMMLEVVEHLDLEVTLEYLSRAYELLEDNSILFLSTPNIEHINQLWKQDVTHIRQYPAKDIYSLLRMIGFSEQIDVTAFLKDFIK